MRMEDFNNRKSTVTGSAVSGRCVVCGKKTEQQLILWLEKGFNFCCTLNCWAKDKESKTKKL